MAEVTKSALREQLEGAMEDVAMLLADAATYQERLAQVRTACAEVWKMADLGAVPEWEVRAKAVKVS